MRAYRGILRNQRGFTAAELLVASAVIGLVLAGLFLLQQEGQQAYLMGSNRVEAQQNARVGLELMTRELRSAQAVTNIPSASDISFTDQNGVAVRYALNATTINRTDNTGTTPLLGGVQNLTLTYFSAWDGATNTGTTTTVPAQVRAIRIRLATRTEESVASYAWGSQGTSMESMVRLRNR